jgi:mRNA-degrading endonuclease RelE of RelBE toxin-antitoxin system
VKQFDWEPAARSDLRRLERDTAVRILYALSRYGSRGEGNVNRLIDREGLCRLRVGKWRIFFDLDTPDRVRIHGIDSRGEAS